MADSLECVGLQSVIPNLTALSVLDSFRSQNRHKKTRTVAYRAGF